MKRDHGEFECPLEGPRKQKGGETLQRDQFDNLLVQKSAVSVENVRVFFFFLFHFL